MFEKIKRSLDDAYQTVKSGTSKATWKAEEKTKLTRLNMKITSLKRDMDAVMAQLGNRIYTLREQQGLDNVFQDETITGIFEEADKFQGEVAKLQEEMKRISEEYEGRLQAAEAETAKAAEEKKEQKKEEESLGVGKD
jgi:hypothetical protein